jgi:tetratricopeptide (TPR) repeat protein
MACPTFEHPFPNGARGFKTRLDGAGSLIVSDSQALCLNQRPLWGPRATGCFTQPISVGAQGLRCWVAVAIGWGVLGWCVSLLAAGPSALGDLRDLGVTAPGHAEQQLPKTATQRASALAHYSAALQAESEGDLRLALSHFRALVQEESGQADLVRRAADLARRYGEEGEAEAMLLEAVKKHPDRAAPTLRLIEYWDAYHAEPEVRQRANELMRQAVTRFPQEVEVLSMAVVRALVGGEREQAMTLMRGSLEREVPEPGFWLALASVAQEVWPLGQPELAEEHRAEVNVFFNRALEAAIRAEDQDKELEVAQYYLLSNQLDIAQGICEKMANRDGNLTARKVLYRLYEAKELPEKAFAVLEGIVRDDPADVVQRRLLAEVLERRKRYPEAAAQLEAAIQVGTGAAADYEKLANLWLGLREPDRAVTLVTRAVRLFPDAPGFRAQLGMAYSAKDDLPRAIKAFEEADQMATDGGMVAFNHVFYFRYGVVLERAARHAEAAVQLEKSIEMTPDSEPEQLANRLNYLGYMWADLGQQLDKAAELIQRAVALEPENPAFLDSLGWLYHRQGKHQEALVELQRAEALLKELQPEDAEILEHIAQVQEALGQVEAAVKTLERAAALDTPDERVSKRVLDALKRLKPAP